MTKFRVGIGAGYVSAHHIRAVKSLSSIQIAGIADLDLARAQAVAQTFDLPNAYGSVKELLASGVDVVHVLTPPAFHAALSIQALQAGAHVLVEKPMAETPEQCKRMMEAVRASGRTLGVVHSARLDPIVLRGVEIVRRGGIGEVISIDFHRGSDYPAWPGGGKLPPQYRKGSYPFQDLGVHGLAIAEAFLGPVKSAEIDFSSTGRDSNLLFDEWTAKVKCERGEARLYLSWNVRPVRSQSAPSVANAVGITEAKASVNLGPCDSTRNDCSVRRRLSPGSSGRFWRYARMVRSCRLHQRTWVDCVLGCRGRGSLGRL